MKMLTKNSFSQQKGFTLIELVVVIVILGILAATAAPKFIDLTSDARESVMEGVQGSINSAVNLVHAKAIVEGQTGDTGVITIGGTAYALVHGYPSAVAVTGTGAGAGIEALIDLDTNTDISFSNASPNVVTHSGSPDSSTCSLTYTNAANAESRPDLTAVLTAC